jgi:hypothetical protein
MYNQGSEVPGKGRTGRNSVFNFQLKLNLKFRCDHGLTEVHAVQFYLTRLFYLKRRFFMKLIDFPNHLKTGEIPWQLKSLLEDST